MNYVTQEERLQLLDISVKRLSYRWWLLLSGVTIGFLVALCAVLICFQVLQQKQAAYEQQLQIEMSVYKAGVTELTTAQTELILNLEKTIVILSQFEKLRKDKRYDLNRGRDTGSTTSKRDTTGG